MKLNGPEVLRELLEKNYIKKESEYMVENFLDLDLEDILTNGIKPIKSIPTDELNHIHAYECVSCGYEFNSEENEKLSKGLENNKCPHCREELF